MNNKTAKKLRKEINKRVAIETKDFATGIQALLLNLCWKRRLKFAWRIALGKSIFSNGKSK